MLATVGPVGDGWREVRSDRSKRKRAAARVVASASVLGAVRPAMPAPGQQDADRGERQHGAHSRHDDPTPTVDKWEDDQGQPGHDKHQYGEHALCTMLGHVRDDTAQTGYVLV